MIALRNNNGGRLIIGFNNDSMKAVMNGRPADVRETFGQDAIQALASKYSSDPFEVWVQYPKNDDVVNGTPELIQFRPASARQI